MEHLVTTVTCSHCLLGSQVSPLWRKGCSLQLFLTFFLCVCMIFGIWLALPGLKLYGKNHI